MIPVIQYSSPDPSLSTYPNFGQFIQYLITGTNYILDSKAQLVYLFNPANLGVLEVSQGSYSEFLQYLLANPVTSVLPNPNGPPGGSFGFPYNFLSVPPLPSSTIQSVFDNKNFELLEDILLELCSIRCAVVSLATQGGVATEQDFDPTRDAAFSGSQSVSFS